jgi:hypothetical protein
VSFIHEVGDVETGPLLDAEEFDPSTHRRNVHAFLIVMPIRRWPTSSVVLAGGVTRLFRVFLLSAVLLGWVGCSAQYCITAAPTAATTSTPTWWRSCPSVSNPWHWLVFFVMKILGTAVSGLALYE